MSPRSIPLDSLWLTHLIAFGVLIFSAGCLHQPRWSKTDAFVAELRCGMSRDTIESVVAKYRGLQLYTPESGVGAWDLFAEKGNTTIRMKLGTDGLQKYRISWIDTIKHVSILPEVDLCEGSASTSLLLEKSAVQAGECPAAEKSAIMIQTRSAPVTSQSVAL